MNDIFNTSTENEARLIEKLEKLVVGSAFYAKYHETAVIDPYSANRRIGRITVHLPRSCYEQTYGQLKKVVIKKAGLLESELSKAFGEDGTRVVFTQDRSSREVYFTLLDYHKPVTVDVNLKWGYDGLCGWPGKVNCLAERLNSLFRLVDGTNYVVSFHLVSEDGRALKNSQEFGVNHIRDTKDNYGAHVMWEAARLLKEIFDTSTYEGFVPNLARIVANDTGDVYNVEL